MREDPRRALILEAAQRLLRHYGLTKTTVADIARAAGIGVGTVYLEFDSKDSLFGSLAEHRHRGVLEAEERAWSEPGSARMRLERTLTARFEAFILTREEGPHAIDLFRCGSCHAIEAARRSFEEAERRLYTRFIEEGSRAGELASDDPAEDATALLAAYAAFTPPLVFEEPAERARPRLRRLHRIVLEGLLRR